MKYNFDKKINRSNNHSTKWSEMGKNFISNDLLPFWVADMDFETCPEILEAMREKLDQNIFGYVYRPDSYFQSVCDWTKERYEYDMSPSTLIHSPGVVPSISLIMRLFVDKNDKVMISTPVYPPFHNVPIKNNRTLVTNPLVLKDGMYTIDFEDFENKASNPDLKWYILCNPHNPTGRVWTKEELQQIADICLKYDIRVISDEIWRDLVYKGHKYTPFASLSKEIEDITITCFSATKTFNLAGLQASYAVFPRKDEFDKFTEELSILDITRNSSFNVVALETAFTKGEDWLNELLDYLEGNLNYLEDFIKDNLPKIEFIKPQATYVVWLDFRKYGIDNINLYLQEHAKVALTDGIPFSQDAKGFLRMNIACPRYQLEEGLNRIHKALQNL